MLGNKALIVATLLVLLTSNTGCVHWKHQIKEHCIVSELAAKHHGEYHRCSHCGKVAAGDGFNSCPAEHATESGLIHEGMLESEQQIPSTAPISERDIHSSGDLDIDAAGNVPAISSKDPMPFTVKASSQPAKDSATPTDNKPKTATDKLSATAAVKKTAKAGSVAARTRKPSLEARASGQPTPLKIKAASPTPADKPALANDKQPTPVQPTPAAPIKPAGKPTAAKAQTMLVEAPRPSLNEIAAEQPRVQSISTKPMPQQRASIPAETTCPVLQDVKRIPLPVASQLNQAPVVEAKPAIAFSAPKPETKVTAAKPAKPAVVTPSKPVASGSVAEVSTVPLPRKEVVLDISAAPREPVAAKKAVAWRQPVATIRVATAPITTSTTAKFAVARMKKSVAPVTAADQRVELPLRKVSPGDGKGAIPIRKVRLHIDPETEDDVYSLSDQPIVHQIVPDNPSPTKLKIPTPPADTNEVIDSLSERYPTPVRPIKAAEPTVQTKPEPIKEHYRGERRDEYFPTPVRRIQLTRYQNGQ